jgi:glycosyltransferase family protein
MNRKYYSSMISRFYIEYKDKSKIPYYIKKLKQIWDKKDILIIEGEMSRLGVGNDLFNNSKSIKRILCPAINAFNVYEKIISQAKKIDKSNLILLALGPTSSVLAYDLYKIGYQVIDVGHIDIEYEWFLRKAKKKFK